MITQRTYSRYRLCRIHHSRRRRGCIVPYDDDGNQTLVTTKTGTWRVTYNGENRPVRLERLNSSTPNSNTPSLITMTFDHQGRRREYLEVAANGTTNRHNHFTYDNYLQIANCNLQLATGNLQLFVWDPTEPVATRPLVFYQPNASSQLYAHDGNKNVSELVFADNGTITAHYEYSSFGEVILSSGDLALINPFRFSSEYSDDALGLVNIETDTTYSTGNDPCVDFEILRYMQGLVGQRANYSIIFQNCRAFSTAVYNKYKKGKR